MGAPELNPRFAQAARAAIAQSGPPAATGHVSAPITTEPETRAGTPLPGAVMVAAAEPLLLVATVSSVQLRANQERPVLVERSITVGGRGSCRSASCATLGTAETIAIAANSVPQGIVEIKSREPEDVSETSR
jgi:hypothetical protein